MDPVNLDHDNLTRRWQFDVMVIWREDNLVFRQFDAYPEFYTHAYNIFLKKNLKPNYTYSYESFSNLVYSWKKKDMEERFWGIAEEDEDLLVEFVHA